MKENKTLLEFNEIHPSSWWNTIPIFFAQAIVIVNGEINQPIVSLNDGSFRLVLLAVGFYSSHQELGYNYNILLFNQLCFFFSISLM
jgi:hypothetical protein